jgi:hypothetical protein
MRQADFGGDTFRRVVGIIHTRKERAVFIGGSGIPPFFFENPRKESAGLSASEGQGRCAFPCVPLFILED